MSLFERKKLGLHLLGVAFFVGSAFLGVQSCKKEELLKDADSVVGVWLPDTVFLDGEGLSDSDLDCIKKRHMLERENQSFEFNKSGEFRSGVFRKPNLSVAGKMEETKFEWTHKEESNQYQLRRSDNMNVFRTMDVKQKRLVEEIMRTGNIRGCDNQNFVSFRGTLFLVYKKKEEPNKAKPKYKQ